MLGGEGGTSHSPLIPSIMQHDSRCRDGADHGCLQEQTKYHVHSYISLAYPPRHPAHTHPSPLAFLVQGNSYRNLRCSENTDARLYVGKLFLVVGGAAADGGEKKTYQLQQHASTPEWAGLTRAEHLVGPRRSLRFWNKRKACPARGEG